MLTLTCFALASLLAAPDWKAGVSVVDITPEKPTWMAGFASRKHASEGTLEPLYVRALALEDASGARAVLITSDLLGFTRDTAGAISERARKQYGLSRERILFNSSHTHGGPVIERQLEGAYFLGAEQWATVDAYTAQLKDKVVDAIGRALKDLRPARLSWGSGTAGFAVNYRVKRAKGWVHGPNPEGPVDKTVPVLRVDSPSGEMRAVVFGYASHPTVLFQEYRFNSDYVGFARESFEKRHPGAVAMFVQGFGGDAKTHPRGTVEHARKYGEELSAAVDRALAGKVEPIRGGLSMQWSETPLQFRPLTVAELEARARGTNVFEKQHAARMLELYKAGTGPRQSYPYPVQVWRLGDGPLFVALGGEVVVDYAFRLRKELGDRVWTAGYSNDVFAYIPSVRILEEGGYEGGDAMMYYMQPGPFERSVEDAIVTKVKELVKRLD